MSRSLPRPVEMPWGLGSVVDEVSIFDDYKELVVQLIEWEEGGESLRFCQYWPNGRFQRQPMLISVDDLKRLGEAARRSPRIAGHLRALCAQEGSGARRKSDP